MVSLSLTVGPWNLSLELGRAEEESLQVVTLRDLTSMAEETQEDAEEASFGFGPVEAHDAQEA